MIEEVLKHNKSKKRWQTGISSQTHPGVFTLLFFFAGVDRWGFNPRLNIMNI